MTNQMKTLLQLEEVGQFLFSIFLFRRLYFAWWLFPALLLTPDISMLGYLISPKVGAISYNIFHHKFIAIAIMVTGFHFCLPILSLAGIILYGHSAMDRMLGYGLKYGDSFYHTHLGTMSGKK